MLTLSQKIVQIVFANVVLVLIVAGGTLMGVASSRYPSNVSSAVLFHDGMFIAGFVLIMLLIVALVNWIVFCCCTDACASC